RLTAGRTTFVIAHDHAAVADADLVVRIEGGRIVAQGPPEDVLGTNDAQARRARRHRASRLAAPFGRGPATGRGTGARTR
ncbi:MAG: hypothetical protein KY450_14420, partial [Actinobacteria bacterium]|nr:hypothetical protein [Actinomycetota bacterium]